MNYKKATCTACKQPRLIINQKHQLCGVCNHKRLNPEPKVKEKKLQKQVRQRSKKQERIDTLLKVVYKEIANEREYRCTGCGTYRNLSHSHLIPRSRRRDLITLKKNIHYHCLDTPDRRGCHHVYEHGSLEERKQLLDFEQVMDAIREMDLEYYYLRGGE